MPVGLTRWAHFRTTKAAVKMHTLLDLRGNKEFYPHLGWQAAPTFCPRCSAGSGATLRFWIVATSTVPSPLHQAGPSSSRKCPVAHRCSRSIRRRRIEMRHHLLTRRPGLHPSGLQGPRVRARWSSHQQLLAAQDRCALPPGKAQVRTKTLLQWTRRGERGETQIAASIRPREFVFDQVTRAAQDQVSN